jgi:hypothetical protein
MYNIILLGHVAYPLSYVNAGHPHVGALSKRLPERLQVKQFVALV